MRLEDIQIGRKYIVDTSLRKDWPTSVKPILPKYKGYFLVDGDIITPIGVCTNVPVVFGDSPDPSTPIQYKIDAAIFLFYPKQIQDGLPNTNFSLVPIDWLKPLGKEYPLD